MQNTEFVMRSARRSYLAEGAIFTGQYDIPCVKSNCSSLPTKVITFSKALKSKDYDAWVVFYEDDEQFERLWNNPKRYLNLLKKFKGVVSPDYSLNGDMPICEQMHNVYRSRILAHWFQRNGIEIIINVRWGIKETFSFCFDGLYENDVFFVGSHGSIKNKENRIAFSKGLDELVERLHPRKLLVYGFIPDDVFSLPAFLGVEIIRYESEFSITHKKRRKQWDLS